MANTAAQREGSNLMRNLVFIGPPGCGKGTQSNILKENSGYTHVSTGDLLRAEVSKGTKLGQKISEVMESGALVTDELVTELLKANIDLSSKQYIFDGFPRNLKQAEILDELLGSSEYSVIYFKVNTDHLIDRISNRRVSSDGKFIYNLISNPPTVSGKCDQSGLHLIQREDDKEEVVRKRMKVYINETEPMIDFYRKKNILEEVDAEKPIENVTEQINKVLKLRG